MAGTRLGLRIAVIGAGAGGIATAIRLRERGVSDVVIFEKAGEPGGTWRDNTYPGITCDVPSHLYRFSFAPNPDWSHKYSPGPEIQAYMRKVAADYGVEARIRFNSEVLSAAWRDGAWEIVTNQGPQGRFDAVITAVGILHHPALPDIEGLGDFAGAAFHTARWDHSIPLEGKRIGVIGTGSTAIQVVPAIVDRAAKVSLFQRTPQWILPEPNLPIAEEKRAAYRADPALLADQYDHLAQAFNGAFCAAVAGEAPDVYARMAQACLDNLNTVADPELRARLTPDYRMGCKRLIVSSLFYPAIQRLDAELVTDGISRIEAGGVWTVDGRLHELDILVLATGFDAHHPFGDMRITGRSGRPLSETWAKGNVTYRGVTVPDLPNWFMLGGPNSPLGNFSFLMTAERQLDYVLQLVGLLLAGRAREITPREEPTQAWTQALKDKLAGSIWASGCRSWYFDAHGNVATYPWSYETFEAEMKAPVLEDYALSA
ncbi:NAD(P)/FAD-dependent oxidoreductase [Phenylobacterium sp.]|uniref:flavin-containing monooxygenase n=1 Tax=Phenylobacterium sp. TaxID=1871053 RepID=UPI0025D6CCC7|nr:NAD(P)/FAD-dependent oxidoreductase [Phenylobacterium sp.]MCA6285477.1 NAD(P)/FAD-dependent oxidoreductase [Phenylobacterium sp.]MCA6288463.1 NAD(P)/FAD-dependent oxidoreductase [Phenylobacterium sp.]MCA6309506.1 NAD(P)/FAD-dependent oxidoreductase [Phenylobacterium sp.]MCA6323093.1 NAD(P)/FAD-dependent oxidoreductase [Phenylobacterium sp.]MCA6337483.1 NAD(P)/FAD-dependent oxidoreductase [Phenylobacterium sp.]